MGLPCDDPPPVPPEPPDPGDCCGGGCVRCVFDVHEEALERHALAFARWRGRHPELDPDVK
ncbi:MAG: hypothetical protein EOP90_13245 [Lysobacteraceae bacterium]|nr:MAG: hypothetical protein EOP90_13245 [Xanthomonadaceae bacterium]